MRPAGAWRGNRPANPEVCATYGGESSIYSPSISFHHTRLLVERLCVQSLLGPDHIVHCRNIMVATVD